MAAGVPTTRTITPRTMAIRPTRRTTTGRLAASPGGFRVHEPYARVV
jgi:hypothetical protein